MTLFKLSLGNIRRSLRDYAIYFFTLVIGVSVFYVFNAIGEQAAMLRVSESHDALVVLLSRMLSAVSVFVACVLGLLIVYASRFLMKRRNREFAVYMLLGMGKGGISVILLLEMVFIGLFSLAVGLLIGLGLSQLMSALVVSLFAADMSAYRFMISGRAIGKTIICFAVMYLVVILFNNVTVSRMRLIELLQSGKRSERIRLKAPFLCVFVFVLAAAVLGYAYHQVGWRFLELDRKKVTIDIALGVAATFLIFWSVSGLLLRVVRSMERVYFRGLNAFTFRQISSKVNTMVLSMTVICLMLFVTICTLAAAFTIRNSMNANMKTLCPADFEIEYREYADAGRTELLYGDIVERYAEYGCDLTAYFSDYVHFHSYYDPDFTFGAFLGDRLETVMEQYRFLNYHTPFDLYRLSDYNELMRLYGREELTLDADEYILLCDFQSMKAVLDDILVEGYPIQVWGHTLRSRYAECQDGFIDLASQHINAGLFILPDELAEAVHVRSDYLIGNYRGNTKAELAVIEKSLRDAAGEVYDRYYEEGTDGRNLISWTFNTRLDISEAVTGIGAILAFLGLYIGMVFLIVCGAILALKELSESVDSISRYELLRRIGARERDIQRSLLRQIGIFFLLPLLLAGLHSVFGMRFAVHFLEIFGTEKIGESILITVLILLMIYGGYFLITYYSSRRILREKSDAPGS